MNPIGFPTWRKGDKIVSEEQAAALNEIIRVTREMREAALKTAIAERVAGNAACGVGDPYPHDVKCLANIETFRALGGTEEELQAAWREAQNTGTERDS